MHASRLPLVATLGLASALINGSGIAQGQGIPELARAGRSILAVAARSKATDPSYIARVVSTTARSDPGLATRALEDLERVDPAAVDLVLGALPEETLRLLKKDALYERIKRLPETPSPEPTARMLSSGSIEKLFKEESLLLNLAKQDMLKEALTKAEVMTYSVDGTFVDKHSEAWKSAGEQARERALPILEEVLNDLPVSSRGAEELKDAVRIAFGKAAKKYKFEFDLASGRLKLPYEREVFGGKVSFSEVNVYKIVMALIGGIAAVPWLPDTRTESLKVWSKLTGEESRYEVKKGDVLWKIAERFYGDGTKWKLIAEANKIAKPDSLTVGMSLVIPTQKE